MTEILENEWPYVIAVDQMDGAPLVIEISPDEAQIERLKHRLGVHGIKDCNAKLKLTMESGHRVQIEGVVEATVEQTCVVSLEPVATHVQEDFKAWYADHEQAVSLAKVKHDRTVQLGQAEMPILEEHDSPEPIVDGKIDVGELAAQYLSLGIDPYPLAEGVERGAGDEAERIVHEESIVTKNPFAALKDWKDKLK